MFHMMRKSKKNACFFYFVTNKCASLSVIVVYFPISEVRSYHYMKKLGAFIIFILVSAASASGRRHDRGRDKPFDVLRLRGVRLRRTFRRAAGEFRRPSCLRVQPGRQLHVPAALGGRDGQRSVFLVARRGGSLRCGRRAGLRSLQDGGRQQRLRLRIVHVPLEPRGRLAHFGRAVRPRTLPPGLRPGSWRRRPLHDVAERGRPRVLARGYPKYIALEYYIASLFGK